MNEPDLIFCATGDAVTKLDFDFDELEALRKARTVRVWLESKSVGLLTAVQVREGLTRATAKMSRVGNVDFPSQARESGAQMRIYSATKEMMWQWFPRLKPSPEFPRGRVPLAAQNGNRIYLYDADRWGRDTVILEGALIHEFCHFFRLQYPENQADRKHSLAITDLMHAHLPVYEMSPVDIQKFQGRVGRRA